MLLIDGCVAGIWERRTRGRRVEIRVEPFVPLTTPQGQQVEAEAVRIGESLDIEVALALGTLA